MEIRPKSISYRKEDKVNILNKINIDKMKLKKIKYDKDGFIKRLLLNAYKLKSVINKSIDSNQKINYIKKNIPLKLTPFQIYQKLKIKKKNDINKRSNINSLRKNNKLIIISKNRTYTEKTNSNISYRYYKKENSESKIKNIKIIKSRNENFDILKKYNSMSDFTRMIHKDLLKIKKCSLESILTNNYKNKFNGLKRKYNNFKLIQHEKMKYIDELKDKFNRYPPTIYKNL